MADPLPVLAVSVMDRQCCHEGELFPLDRLPDRLAETQGHWNEDRQIPRSIVATDDPGALLTLLDRRFARRGEPGRHLWQWTMSLRSSSVWLGKTPSTYDALTPHLCTFGWAAQRGHLRRAQGCSRYYPVLDVFGWTAAAEILDEYPGLLVEQMTRFATDLQAFCHEHKLRSSWTAAGIAGQLLKRVHRQKRKVPKATNARAREHLPGNFYRITLPRPVSEQEQPLRIRGEVLEVDMQGAHHWAAMHLNPPVSDQLYAWGGYYQVNPTPVYTGKKLDRIIRSEHGLLLCAVESYARLDPLAHPATNHQGMKWRYLWTPEIPLLQQTPGVSIHAIAAGWTAPEPDHDLNEYAWWAANQQQNAPPHRRRWQKQALLAAYGLLAARPRAYTSLTRWGRGDPMTVTLPSGHHAHGRVRTTPEAEPRTTNVIWRGMIEAWTRAETITQARQLRADGWRIISIYADAIYIIAQDDRTPQLRAGWRTAQRLHNMTLDSSTHFTSNEIDKLPGIPKQRRANR